MIKRLRMHEKASIWECFFFAFTVCRENTYISRLLAILFIHKTELIFFFNNFIIKKDKNCPFSSHVMLCKKYCVRRSQCAKKSSRTLFSVRKNNFYLNIWEVFSPFNKICRSHFCLHTVKAKKSSHMEAFSCIRSLLIIILFALRYTGT